MNKKPTISKLFFLKLLVIVRETFRKLDVPKLQTFKQIITLCITRCEGKICRFQGST